MDYETTAFYVEGETFDLCGGHATTDGTYHYHSTPGCLQEHAMAVDGTTSEEHSPILGWSYVSPRGVLWALVDGAAFCACVRYLVHEEAYRFYVDDVFVSCRRNVGVGSRRRVRLVILLNGQVRTCYHQLYASTSG